MTKFEVSGIKTECMGINTEELIEIIFDRTALYAYLKSV